MEGFRYNFQGSMNNLMRNERACSPERRGFTLIEILVIVAIIAILVTAIMVSIGESRKKARISSVLTSAKSALPIIVSCNDLSPTGHINFPSGTETGTMLICQEIAGSFWPKLLSGYTYADSGDYTENCNFEITTVDRAANIKCSCEKQSCQ